MRIEVELECRYKDEAELRDDFFEFIISHMRADIIQSIPISKLNCYEFNIVNSTTFGENVTKIDMEYLLRYVVSHLVYIKTKESYVIKFSSKREPKTKKSVDSIARFIDKGNEEFPGMHIIGTVFNKYRANMNKYWKFFIREELNRVSVSEVLVVR